MNNLPNLQAVLNAPLTVEQAQALPEINFVQQMAKKLGSRGVSGNSIAVFLDKDCSVMHVVQAEDGYYKRRML